MAAAAHAQHRGADAARAGGADRARGQGSARRQRHDHRRSSVAADMGDGARSTSCRSPAAHPREEVRSGLRRAAGFLRGEVGAAAGAAACAAAASSCSMTRVEGAAHLTQLIDRAVADRSRRARRRSRRRPREPRRRDRRCQRHPAARQAARAVLERGAAARAPAARRHQGRPRRQPRSARDRHAADLPRRGDQDRRRDPARSRKRYRFTIALGRAHGHRRSPRARSSSEAPVPRSTGRQDSQAALQRISRRAGSRCRRCTRR